MGTDSASEWTYIFHLNPPIGTEESERASETYENLHTRTMMSVAHTQVQLECIRFLERGKGARILEHNMLIQKAKGLREQQSVI